MFMPIYSVVSPQATGKVKVVGSVTVEGSAASKRVGLLDRRYMSYLGMQWSASNGGYAFKGLPPQLDGVPLTVIAFDDAATTPYNAVVADHIVPVLDA